MGGAAPFSGEGEERVKFFLGFIFCVASLFIAKLPPLYNAYEAKKLLELSIVSL
jgi:hypothetical protein